jgi:hypothetical protein
MGEPIISSPSRGKPHDSVTVAVRVRPLNRIELGEGNAAVFQVANGNQIKELDDDTAAPSKEYFYDFAFGSESGTGDVYQKLAMPITDAALEGFNGTIFACEASR